MRLLIAARGATTGTRAKTDASTTRIIKNDAAPAKPSCPAKQRILTTIQPTRKTIQPQAMAAQSGYFMLKGNPKQRLTLKTASSKHCHW